MTDKPKHEARRWVRWMLMAGAGLLVLALAAWGIRGLMDGKTSKAKKPPKINLMPDKPPPPPPPPKEKPEPPKPEEKEIKTEPPKEPMPQADNEPLKMEGAAGDGPSPFAAGSVGKEYSGGSVGGFQGAYANRLQRHLQDVLNRNRKLKESDYRVTISIWLGRDGSIQRAELGRGTGNATLDELLTKTLMQSNAALEAPPENLPQPIRIRVTARGTT